MRFSVIFSLVTLCTLCTPLSLSSDLLPKMRHFLDESPTPYHASQNLASTFFSGYTQLSEMEDWSGKLQPGGSYYFLREGTSIVAFRVGKKVTTSSLSRFKITAAHTDSPNLRLKPFSKNSKTAQSNLQRVNTECYGYVLQRVGGETLFLFFY